MSWKLFFSNFRDSFEPAHYYQLCSQSSPRAFQYFFRLLLFMTILTGILYIPTLTDVPSRAEQEFSKLSNISLEVSATGNGAVQFGPLTIDLNNDNRSLQGQGVLITNSKIETRILPLTKKSSITFVEFNELINDEMRFRKIAGSTATFLAPYLLFLLYLYHAIKYLIVIFITAGIIIIIVRTAHGDVPARASFKAALYASFFLMLELPLQVFIESWTLNTLAPYLVFVVFYLLTLFSFEPERIIVPKKEYEHLRAEVEKDIFANLGISGDEGVDMDRLQKDLKQHRVK